MGERDGRERWEREMGERSGEGNGHRNREGTCTCSRVYLHTMHATCTPVRYRGRKHGLKKTLERPWTRDSNPRSHGGYVHTTALMSSHCPISSVNCTTLLSNTAWTRGICKGGGQDLRKFQGTLTRRPYIEIVVVYQPRLPLSALHDLRPRVEGDLASFCWRCQRPGSVEGGRTVCACMCTSSR